MSEQHKARSGRWELQMQSLAWNAVENPSKVLTTGRCPLGGNDRSWLLKHLTCFSGTSCQARGLRRLREEDIGLSRVPEFADHQAEIEHTPCWRTHGWHAGRRSSQEVHAKLGTRADWATAAENICRRRDLKIPEELMVRVEAGVFERDGGGLLGWPLERRRRPRGPGG